MYGWARSLHLGSLPGKGGCCQGYTVLLPPRYYASQTTTNNNRCPGGLAGHLYSWWHSVSPANRRRSHDFNLSSSTQYDSRLLEVSTNRDMVKEVWLVCPITHPYLVCYTCGFRPAHFPPLLSGSPTSVGGLQNILLPFPSLNPWISILVNMQDTYIYI